ncbi:MAG: phosphopentomutase, partial [Mesorhizobium sp.]
MARAFLFVLDSFGIGGADTFGHIALACAQGRADREGLRRGPLAVPNMMSLGLARAAETATGFHFDNDGTEPLAATLHGAAQEISSGKDTPSGHWEIAGLPVRFDWGYFPETVPAFPAALTEAMIREGKVPGILGDCHAGGIEIIERFGEEH